MNTPEFQQQENALMAYPSGGWRRLMFKAPLQLWRLGLGFIIGRIIMVLTVTGRRTGLPRHTMVEYYRLDGTPYAVSAFGERSQWYRNLVANPQVTIQTAQGVESMRASRVTDPDEIARVYEFFMRRDPPLTGWYLASLGIEATVADVVAKRDRLHFVRFEATDEPTPPPLQSDLSYVIPTALCSLVAAWLIRKLLRR